MGAEGDIATPKDSLLKLVNNGGKAEWGKLGRLRSEKALEGKSTVDSLQSTVSEETGKREKKERRAASKCGAAACLPFDAQGKQDAGATKRG
jgi:hypothetical protein